MSEPLRAWSPHLTAEDLAAVVEDGASDAGLLRHLAACPRCLAVYGEFLAARRRWFTDPAVQTPNPELVQVGLAIGAPAPPARPRRARHTLSIAARPAAALLAAASLAVLVLSDTPRWPSASRIEDGQRQLLGDRMREDSHGGLLYGDDLIPRAPGVRGAGTNPAVRSALGEILDRYERAPSGDAAYWLVGGLLASGRTRDAEPYLRESLAAFPEDSRLWNLAAILAYKSNDLAGAEGHLRSALRLERSAAALVNLAIVRSQQGFEDESQDLLLEARGKFPGSPLAAHAPRSAGVPAR